jgi:hypothetical protein
MPPGSEHFAERGITAPLAVGLVPLVILDGQGAVENGARRAGKLAHFALLLSLGQQLKSICRSRNTFLLLPCILPHFGSGSHSEVYQYRTAAGAGSGHPRADARAIRPALEGRGLPRTWVI